MSSWWWQGKKERRRVCNTLHQHKIRLQITFSFPPQDFETLKIFKEIAKREAGFKGFSKTLVKAIKEYIEKHGEGNPQLKIASYLPDVKKGPIRVLCWSGLAGATSEGQVYCRRAGVWIQGIRCYSCPDNKLRKKEAKKWIPKCMYFVKMIWVMFHEVR